MSEFLATEFPYMREFTDLLQKLKNRANCSYEALARRSGVSGSTLHRYCSGAGVPNDFEPLARFGKACGAGTEELLELHRLWALVDAGRSRGVPRAGSAPASAAQPVSLAASTSAVSTRLNTSVEPVATGAESTGTPPTRAPDTGPAGRTARTLRPRLRLRRQWPVLVATLVAIGAAMAGTSVLTGGHRADNDGPGLLSSAKCRLVAMGHQDACVRELQMRLKQAGLDLDVDGIFGPFTQMRVVVFQLLAGLEPDGVVDDRTKRALYSGRIKARPWTPAQVDRRVREVFTEDADHASGIAKCAANMDPLYSLGNTNGTRNWGVFQLYENTLRELGGTPRKALDPEWNIEAAHRLWTRTHDFRAWPSCEKAYQAGASKTKPGAPH